MSANPDIERHCLTLDLHDDPVVIAEYDRHHRDVWPEVLVHLRASGIRDMTIWRRESRLVMLIETEPGFDLRNLMVGAGSHPRVQEWEATMARFQKRLPGSDSEGLWQPMEQVFRLVDQLKRST